jgi:hypothetical protein
MILCLLSAEQSTFAFQACRAAKRFVSYGISKWHFLSVSEIHQGFPSCRFAVSFEQEKMKIAAI